jgi:hypothetical protein
MLMVTLNLTSQEWQQIQNQATEQWPFEQLSRAEICRRFALIGTCYTQTAAMLDHASKAELEQMTRQLRDSMTAPDSEHRLKW